MDIPTLTAELDNDPQGLGYAGKAAQEIAALLNADRITGTHLRLVQPEEILDLPGAYGLILDAMDDADPTIVTAGKTLNIYLQVSSGLDVAPGSAFRNTVAAAGFGVGAQKVLEALATEDIVQSRAEELGIGVVGDGHVQSCVRWEKS